MAKKIKKNVKVLRKASTKKRLASVSPKKTPQKELSLLDSTKKKINAFLDINNVKRIAVVSDNDQDGITASVQMKKFLDSKRIESKIFFYDHYAQSLSIPIEEFIKFAPERTIFLDLGDGLISDALLKIGKHTAPFLVIDHHQSEVIRNNSFRCLVIKPVTFSKITPSKYPTSKMVCDLFYCADWVASIGVIGDFAFDEWASFLVKVQKKYKIKRSELDDLDEVVACVSSQYPEKINELFNFICSAKSPKDLLKSEYFTLKKLFDQKLAALKDKFYKEAEYFEDAGVYFFHAYPRFSSKLSNNISTELKNKVIIIFEFPGSMMKCSIRRQDFKVNCGELAKAGVAGTPLGKGGGHIPAAGAMFPPGYLDDFKKRVRMYLLNNPPKEKLL
ncbi:MAG: DHHA1 domain-containing protein [archaeon]|jgi:single-stranded DNA-specific DHH superfamily exonuclease